MNEKELLSKAMSVLGSRSTEKKRAAIKRNVDEYWRRVRAGEVRHRGRGKNRPRILQDE